VDEVLGDLAHAIADGAVVVAGGDDEVRPGDRAVLVDLVVVDQVPRGASIMPTPSSALTPASART